MITLIAALITGPGLLPRAIAADEGQCRPGVNSSALFDRAGGHLTNYLRSQNDPETGSLSAISVAIVAPAGTEILNCGVTTRGGVLLVDSETIYEIGSETKLFTAAAAAQMAENGLVNLDDSMSKYFTGAVPNPACSDPERADITVGMLATHNAGLPRSPNYVTWGERNPTGHANYTRADLQNSFLHNYNTPCDALISAPGTACSYSNWGYALLGMMLADRDFELTNPDQALPAIPAYGDMITQLVTGPLGMTSTRLE